MVKKKTTPTNVEIGALLKIARVKAGLTQVELGEALGVKFQSVSQYETGRAAMTALQLIRAAEACRCTTLDLIP